MGSQHSQSYPARCGWRLYKEVAGMSKWIEYERLKDALRAGKLTPDEYERAVKGIAKELKL
jgi:hypothetical protein